MQPKIGAITLIIKVSANNVEANLYLRQTPRKSGVWNNVGFKVNQDVDKCDWWIVCHNTGLRLPETTCCDPAHVIFISMEPTEAGIPQQFLNQFSKLVLCDRNVLRSDITYANGLTWWVGMNVRHENDHHFDAAISLDYDSLKTMECPEKKNRISVICSKNCSLPGHKKRLNFLEKLKAHPVGSYVDMFGGGINPIMDKWEGIAPYKYHLALENSALPDYWTEKLADPFLGFSYPLYYGCPNIHDYFPHSSLQLIDISNFDKTIRILEELLEKDPYDAHWGAICEARDKVLNQYNIFQLITDICNEPAKSFKKIKLRPVSHFQRSWPRRMARKLIYRMRGIRT
jgi:hypothetical protein